MTTATMDDVTNEPIEQDVPYTTGPGEEDVMLPVNDEPDWVKPRKSVKSGKSTGVGKKKNGKKGAPVGTAAASNDDRQYYLNNPNIVHEFELDELVVDQAKNGRFKLLSPSDPDIKDLAKSLATQGQKIPGLVTYGLDGLKYLTAGNRRYIALGIVNGGKLVMNRLKFRALVEVEQPNNAVQAALDNAIENIHRKETTALDKCKIVGTLMAPPNNLTAAQIHDKLSLSKPLIHTYKLVWASGEATKQYIAAERISVKGVYEIATVDKENVDAHVEKLVTRAGLKSVSADTCSEYARGLRESGAGAKGKKKAGIKTKKAKQRTSAQIVKFLDGVTKETLAEYEDKALPVKLKIVRTFVGGGTEEAFLRGMAGL